MTSNLRNLILALIGGCVALPVLAAIFTKCHPACKEKSRGKTILLGTEAEVPAHSQCRKPDIDPVDIGHETGGEEQRQCPPADAANRLPSRIRPRLFSKRFMVQVMLLWNGAATPEKQIGAMVMRAIGIAGLL